MNMHLVVLFQLLFVYYLGCTVAQNVQQPPAKFPKDNSTSTIPIFERDDSLLQPAPSQMIAPRVFPDHDPKILSNSNTTILNKLISQTDHSNKIDTEVSDLLKTNHKTEHNVSEQNTETTPKITSNKEPSITDTELIQSDVSKTEDLKINKSVTTPLSTTHLDHNHTYQSGVPVLQGQLAAILAVVFAIIAVAAYMGLLTWRKFLEGRYGNREMLVNEEEYVNVNYSDMKNFEL